MRILLVLGVIGHLLRYFSVAFVLPMLLAAYDREWASVGQFAIALAAALTIGVLFSLGYRRVSVFRRSEAMGVVSGTWLVVALIGSLPFIFSGLPIVDAFFESMSGFTTTGATILRDFDDPRYGRAFFLWRAMTQWFGGLGVIALFVVVLPRLGIAGRQLFFAEASGAASEPLTPQIRSTAQRLWALYSILTGIETVALIIAGMSPYDAFVHSLTTLAAGGFSPNGQSIAGYQNPAAEWIIIVFMLLAGASFTLQYRAFTQRPSVVFRDGEFLFYIGVAVFGGLGVAALVDGGSMAERVRLGLFQSASLISSTGYASADYALWGDSAKVLLVLVMLVGGCAGSAAGGAKAIRLLLVLKLFWSELTRVLHPRAVLPIRYGERTIPTEILRAVVTLWGLYLLGYLLVGSVLVLFGSDLVTGFSASLACLGNIGPGFQSVGPMGNFADLPTASKLVLTGAMWVGRLEIVAVLALLHPDVWRKLQLRGSLSETSHARA